MKLFIGVYLTAAMVIIFFASGCNNSKRPKIQRSAPSVVTTYGTTIYMITIENHDYLVNTRGGIIHAKSCPCYKNK